VQCSYYRFLSVHGQGYKKQHDDLCYTVFSAPNYCGRHDNKGAILQFSHPSNTAPEMVQFEGRHYLPCSAATSGADDEDVDVCHAGKMNNAHSRRNRTRRESNVTNWYVVPSIIMVVVFVIVLHRQSKLR